MPKDCAYTFHMDYVILFPTEDDKELYYYLHVTDEETNTH